MATTPRSGATSTARSPRGSARRSWPASIRPARSCPTAAEMCARFSVSRTALREAYSILSAKALIVARPKIGTRVRPKSDWNLLDSEVLAWHLQATPNEHFIDDLFVLRQMVEPAAAALAASLRSPATVERIAEAYDRMEQFKNGAGDLIGADLDFHMAILEASGNRFLAALGGLIHTALEGTFRLSWLGAARIQDDRLFQHKGIFEAIRERRRGTREDAHGGAVCATRSRTCGNI